MPTPEDEAAAKAAEDLKAKNEADAKAKAEADKTQEKKFTQAELDAIISDRLRRSEEKIAKEQAAAKQKADDEATIKNGEWQKLAEEREARAVAAEKERDDEREKSKKIAVKSAFYSEANKAQFGEKSDKKFIDPDDAYRLAVRDAVTIEGETITGVADALKALAKSKPHLLEAAKATQYNSSPTRGQLPNERTLTQMDQDKLDKKRREGSYASL